MRTNQISRGRVLITGASSGIGAALARKFAGEGFDLILNARRKEPMEELKVSYSGVDIQIITQDLSSQDGTKNLCRLIDDASLQVDILVNNAATALSESFMDSSIEKIERLTTLNMTTATRLIHHFLPGMTQRRSGRILNVASMASFHPVPSMALYAATKAYLLSLTESLAENLKGTGVSITALCPGMTATDALNKKLANSIPQFIIAQPDQVAEEGFDALMRHEVIRVPGEANKIAAAWGKHQPRWLMRSLGGLAAKLTQ